MALAKDVRFLLKRLLEAPLRAAASLGDNWIPKAYFICSVTLRSKIIWAFAFA